LKEDRLDGNQRKICATHKLGRRDLPAKLHQRCKIAVVESLKISIFQGTTAEVSRLVCTG